MSGRRPFSRLTKDFTHEDWEWVEAKKAELRADAARREKSATVWGSAESAALRGSRSRSSPRHAPAKEGAA